MRTPGVSPVLWAAMACLGIVATIHPDERVSMYLVLVGALCLFVPAEGIAVLNRVDGDTKTEWVRARVASEFARWGVGLWYAWLAYRFLPKWWGNALGGALLLWLPAHFALPGWERKVIARARRLFG